MNKNKNPAKGTPGNRRIKKPSQIQLLNAIAVGIHNSTQVLNQILHYAKVQTEMIFDLLDGDEQEKYLEKAEKDESEEKPDRPEPSPTSPVMKNRQEN